MQSLHDKLFFDGVRVGVLEITDGDLQWADHIQCTLACSRCGKQFRLECETYHGGGVRFEVIQ
ncbi:MAG: hypothetical protein ACKVH8_24595 [Pirellulales bacterium]